MLFYSTSIGLVCISEKRFKDCDMKIKFVESEGLNDKGDVVNGWIAFIQEGTLLSSLVPEDPQITSSQGSQDAQTIAQLSCLYIPVFPPHKHDGKKEVFRRGLPKEVVKIARAIFDECNGRIKPAKLRMQVPCIYSLFIGPLFIHTLFTFHFV